MKPVNAAAQAVRAQRRALVERLMVWVEARHRETDEEAGFGVWEGSADEDIVVPDMWTGTSRVLRFHGAGGVVGIGQIVHEAGLTIRPMTLTLSPLHPTVEAAFREYEPRGAKVQIWRRSYDPDTRQPFDAERVFLGYVNGAPITRPEPGGEAAMEVELVSTARMLTVTSAALKSDEAQRARSPGDRFRRHKATIAQVTVDWEDD